MTSRPEQVRRVGGKPLVTIGDVLPQVVARLQEQSNPTQETVNELWKQLAGDTAFKHSRPGTLRKKVFSVKVDSPAWLAELEFSKRGLLKGLKRALGKDRISEIRFKIGEF